MATPEIPTPSPVPSPSSGPFSLSERINISTRSMHSQLNRLILARLPLALPPHTSNPSKYVSGILHITPIYITFETLWASILNAPQLPTILNQALDSYEPAFEQVGSKSVPIILPPNDGILKPVHKPKVCSRTRSLLAHLQLPGLLRAGRLRADIRVLTGTPEHDIEDQLNAVSKNGRLAEFIVHTTRSVDASPHVLLAYAWVLYMAIFSGGRYLRASLKDAGGSTDFWTRDSSPVRPYSVTRALSPERRNSTLNSSDRPSEPRSRTRSESAPLKMIPGLSFFNFVGSEDGEDLKLEFKKRITEAEVLLTEGEKEDIIQEAQDIFRFMVEMVSELDAVMGTSEEDLLALSHRSSSLSKSSSVFKAQRDSLDIHKMHISRSSAEDGDESAADAVPLRARKPSFLQVFVTNPVSAKIVHFNDNWEAVLTPLKTRLSDRWSPRVSVDDIDGRPLYPAWDLVVRVVVTLLPIGAILVVFSAWYMMDRETRVLEGVGSSG